VTANERNVNRPQRESGSEEENAKWDYKKEKGKQNNYLKSKIFNFQQSPVKVKKNVFVKSQAIFKKRSRIKKGRF
jgi:hypothetical protein